jgi:hypothetical protein
MRWIVFLAILGLAVLWLAPLAREAGRRLAGKASKGWDSLDSASHMDGTTQRSSTIPDDTQ